MAIKFWRKLLAEKLKSLQVAGLLDVGDQRVLVSVNGLAITPKTTDKIKIGGNTLGIKSVVPHAPGGTFYFWEVQARDLV